MTAFKRRAPWCKLALIQVVFHFQVSADKYLWSVWVYEWAVLMSSEKNLDTKLDQIFWDVHIKKLGEQFKVENLHLNSTELKHRCTQIIKMNKWAWLQRLRLFSSFFKVGWQNSSSIGQQHHLPTAQCYSIAFSLQQLSQTSIADLIKNRIQQGFATAVGTDGSIFLLWFYQSCIHHYASSSLPLKPSYNLICMRVWGLHWGPVVG